MSDHKIIVQLVFVWIIVAFVLIIMITTISKARCKQPQRDPEAVQLEAAIFWLADESRAPVTRKRARYISNLFVKYGKKWGVDPWLAASIAYQESNFRDKPSPIKVRRCRTELDEYTGRAVKTCKWKWPGERGIMQMIPRLVRDSYHACTGLALHDPRLLENTRVNICTGMHFMAYRRNKVRRKMKTGIMFRVRGSRMSTRTRIHGPCSVRQVKFCSNGHRDLCKKMWWVGSWNWGTHQVYCGQTNRRFDFEGYPIKILRRYGVITKCFKSRTRKCMSSRRKQMRKS